MAADKDDDEPETLEDLLDACVDAGDGDEVTIGGLLDHFGTRAFGPVMAILAIIAISPVGGIPGLPTVFAVVIALFSVQIVFGREHPWVPGFISKRGVSRDKMKKATDRMRGIARFIDRLLKRRLEALTGRWGQWFAAMCTTLIAFAIPPLELLPFAVAAPAAAILMFGLGITARDGVPMLIGFAATVGTAYLVVANLLLGGN